ncbi:MAG: hypothetical protein ACK551_07345 [Vampirovibrionales bacterium]
MYSRSVGLAPPAYHPPIPQRSGDDLSRTEREVWRIYKNIESNIPDIRTVTEATSLIDIIISKRTNLSLSPENLPEQIETIYIDLWKELFRKRDELLLRLKRPLTPDA